MMSKLLFNRGTLLARKSILRVNSFKINLPTSSYVVLSSNLNNVCGTTGYKYQILHNGKKYSTENSKEDNKIVKQFGYLIVVLFGLHFLLYGGSDVISYFTGGNEEEKETFQHYRSPHSKDKQGLMQYKGVWLPCILIGKTTWPKVKSFKVDPTDVLVISYPKSGTTWVQEIVYLLKNKDRLPEASTESLTDEFPFLEFPYPGIDVIEKKASPKLIKTHLPYDLLPKSVNESKPKMIYVTRNVKDVAVSYYHYHRMITQVSYFGTFNDFLEDFLIGRVSYGSWWNHVKSYLNKGNDSNIHFVSYEDLHKNPVEEIKKMASFLGIEINDKTAEKIKSYSSFNKMKTNPATNNEWMKEYGIIEKSSDPNKQFMRKGQVGDWKNYFSSELAKVLDDKTKKELGSTGLVVSDGT